MLRFPAVGPSRARYVVFMIVLASWAFGICGSAASKGVVDTFGQAGTGAGEFTFAAGVAVNQGTGDVYVADVPTDESGGSGSCSSRRWATSSAPGVGGSRLEPRPWRRALPPASAASAGRARANSRCRSKNL